MELNVLPIKIELTENSYVKIIYKETWKIFIVNRNGKLELDIETASAILRDNPTFNYILKDIINKK